MLVAIDDISNLVGLPSGGSSIYYKSQVDADSVVESFGAIMGALYA